MSKKSIKSKKFVTEDEYIDLYLQFIQEKFNGSRQKAADFWKCHVSMVSQVARKDKLPTESMLATMGYEPIIPPKEYRKL